MTIMWLLIEVLYLFLFFSLPTLPDTAEYEPSNVPTSDHSPSPGDTLINTKRPHGGGILLFKNVKSYESHSSTESTPLLSRRNPSITNTSSVPIYYAEGTSESGSGRGWCSQLCHGVRWRVLELLWEEQVVLLAILFNTMFNDTAIEVCSIM